MPIYNKYIIDIRNYQVRELPKELTTFCSFYRLLREPLRTGIKRFQNELHWDDMWTYWDAKKRWRKGWQLTVFRPSGHQIKGWVWLSTEGEIKNLYVSKWQRRLGWGVQLVYAALNSAMNTDLDEVFYRSDIWNQASQYTIEHVLKEINCSCRVLNVDEKYG